MNTKSIFLLLLLFLFLPCAAKNIVPGSTQVITSPDGAYRFTFFQRSFGEDNMRMCYTVDYKDIPVIEESELGIEIENQLFESALGVPNETLITWCENLGLTDVTRTSKDETWQPVYGERAEIRDCYNEMTLHFSKGAGDKVAQEGYDRRKNYFMDIEVRAYNEGVAFRYHFPETTNGLFLHITGERTSFTMPAGTMAYYERWAQGPYELRPLEGWGNEESERPLTMTLPNGLTVSLTEAAMIDYARGKFALSPDKPSTLLTSVYGSVDVITPYNTPWRVIMVGERAVDIINNNDIVLNLNEPCFIEDTSWIKPGKVFRSNLTMKDVKESIDFAADRGIQYVHMDAGWYGPEMKVSSDATTVADNRDLDMAVLCEYAASKGIGLFVYVNQRALYNQLDELLPLYKKWGLKGIKFGFVQIGNQKWTEWLHEAVRKCADFGMMVDIHDEYRPTGFSRTYPNLMTQEGIAGNEEMPDATHNVILPFTRFIAGAGDYTLCYFNNRVKNTKAHQLAMAAVYYSPLQFMYWYDNAAAYRGEEELEFWKAIPSVWDDSRALDGEVGEYIVQARRSGNEWFVGAMTNTDGRTINVTTDFLTPGKRYQLSLYEDDAKLDTRTKIRITRKKIKAGDKLTLKLLSSGGAALHFVPIN